MPDWSSAQKVLETVRNGDDVAFRRGENRVLVNKMANNDPLMPPDEADRIGMKIYNRWGEGMIALANAARQFMMNFTSQDTYFNASCPSAPEEIRADMGGFVTEKLSSLMKDGPRQMDYFTVHFSKWKSVAAHGIGPMLWEDRYNWIPRTVAIEDLRIPTDVEVSFRNLEWFAVRVAYTPGELSRKAFAKAKSKFKWNTSAVASILENVKECNTTMAENNYDWQTCPEKFEELRKQNAGYWSGDAMPTINLWHFYYQDENKKWSLKIVPDRNASFVDSSADDEFICEYQGPMADSWRHILHVNFGDLNNKAPLMYHSVRSLGFALYEPCYWTDFTRGRFLQHTLDQFNILLTVSDPIDKARAQIQTFQNLSVLKPGIGMVKAADRWQVDAELPNNALAQLKQLQGEASTAYTQSTDTGTAREQTAFETGVKVQQNTAMLNGIMALAKAFEKTASQEIFRRFCLDGTDDEDAIQFQKDFLAAGYPKEWLNVAKWKIEINVPLGSGNPTMAMVEAQNMLQLAPLADPSSQQEMHHDAAVQMIGTARAKRFFSSKQKPVSVAANAAANAFPLMMLGLPPQIPEGLNPIQQIQTLLGLSGGYIAQIEQSKSTATPKELQGLQNVSAYIGKLVQGMSGDKANKKLFAEFGHDLSQLNNEIKKLQQNLAAQMQSAQTSQNKSKVTESLNYKDAPDDIKRQIEQQAGLQPSTQPQTDPKTLKTQQALVAKEVSHNQNMAHKNEAFKSEQGRKDLSTVMEAGRKSVLADSEPATTAST